MGKKAAKSKMLERRTIREEAFIYYYKSFFKINGNVIFDIIRESERIIVNNQKRKIFIIIIKLSLV